MILDTNALSAFLRGDDAIRDAVGSAQIFAVPVVVIGEYLFGLLSSKQRVQLEADLTRLLGTADVLHVTDETAKHYAAIRHELRSVGRPIPQNDAWIAALARQYTLPILSRDAHFDVVVGIARISWP